MSRTKGSGWGAGPLYYQKCPFCGKKKAIYNPLGNCSPFKCTSCKRRFHSTLLDCIKYKKDDNTIYSPSSINDQITFASFDDQ